MITIFSYLRGGLWNAGSGLTHLIASALRRCASIVRSRRLRKEQGGFAVAANLKGVYHNILN
jgi:hypothetical protein